MITLRETTPSDIIILNKISENEPGYFERCFDEGRLIIMAQSDGVDCGYAMLNYKPRYSLYQKLNYPEIQDVNVLVNFRQQGAAKAMIVALEQTAKEAGHEGVGISVGITREFGPAQRLYWKLGYEPDGYGATYDRVSIDSDRLYRSGELCLMMVKEFSK